MGGPGGATEVSVPRGCAGCPRRAVPQGSGGVRTAWIRGAHPARPSPAPSRTQPEPPAPGPASPPLAEEEEKDLNKALGVERFEEILSDAHPRSVEEPGRIYGEEDFECEWGTGRGGGRGAGTATPTPAPPLPTDHRQSSLHIHHPLSAHLPPDARRKKGVPKKGRKKRGRAAAPGENPPIEEGEEDEEEACDTETERSAEELRGGPAEGVQVGGARGAGPFLAVPRPSVQFFLQEDEVTERRAEEPPAPPAPPGPTAEPHGATAPAAAR